MKYREYLNNFATEHQVNVFMAKLHGVVQASHKNYETLSNEDRWEKVKEDVIEFVKETNPNKIIEED
jgi:hypothetical protein